MIQTNWLSEDTVMGEFLQISIGTAQFGLNYGFANQYEKVKENEVNKIFCLATRHGITKLDTAPSYGDAELVIGKIEDVVKTLESQPNYRILAQMLSQAVKYSPPKQLHTIACSFACKIC